jgi:hypothetical protein
VVLLQVLPPLPPLLLLLLLLPPLLLSLLLLLLPPLLLPLPPMLLVTAVATAAMWGSCWRLHNGYLHGAHCTVMGCSHTCCMTGCYSCTVPVTWGRACMGGHCAEELHAKDRKAVLRGVPGVHGVLRG